MPQLDILTFSILLNLIYFGFILFIFSMISLLVVMRKNNYYQNYYIKNQNKKLLKYSLITISIYSYSNQILFSIIK